MGARDEVMAMRDLHTRRALAATARTGFLERGTSSVTGVPGDVLASWSRSRSAGVDPDAVAATYFDDVDFDSRLVRCAEPVIDRLRDDLLDVPMVIALTDERARILRRVDGSAAVGRMLDRVAFSPGFGYGEEGVGTNGVGTTIEARRPLSVVGAEHFAEPLQVFACSGAPIIDPITSRVSGVLDVSTLADDWSPLLRTLVRSAADAISRNLLEDRSRAQRALFEAYLTADARGHQAVVAVGDAVEMSNARAQAMVDPEEMHQLTLHARLLLGRGADATDVVTLAGGRRVRIRGTRVTAGAETAGLLVRLDVADQGDSSGAVGTGRSRGAVSIPAPRAQGAVRTTTPWAAACDEARAAVTTGSCLIAVGEPGSGRTTLVVESFLAVHPGGCVVTVGADRLAEADDADLDEFMPATERPTLLVLQDVDRLDAAGAQRAAGLLAGVGPGGRTIVAATASRIEEDHDPALLVVLPLITLAVTVPPLRRRSDELEAIVTRVLAGLAPGRRVRLDAGAMRLVRGYPWPGNVPELRDALAAALTRRPLGEIHADDLPASCHAVPRRTLTRLEAQEREAILTALHECGGNRWAAAELLGIARSTLYRKLRTYSLEHE
jgi:transcriptional regulator of acetoin/glycerol metabolism